MPTLVERPMTRHSTRLNKRSSINYNEDAIDKLIEISDEESDISGDGSDNDKEENDHDENQRQVKDQPDAIELSSSDDEIEDSDAEEEYVPRGFPKRKHAHRTKSNKSKNHSNKRRRIAGLQKKSHKEYQKELEENLIENAIFKSLNDPDISVLDLANDWLEEYQENEQLAIKNLVNLVLRACGCLSQVEQHDVSNVEAAPDTVSEIQSVFQKQGTHEFAFASKGKQYKAFRLNFPEFIKQVIVQSNERNLLISDSNSIGNKNEEEDEEPEFLENILIWLSSLSTSNLRSLRYVATVVLLTIETTICEILIKCTKNYDKNQMNLNIENDKINAVNKKLKAKSTKKQEKAQISKDLAKYERHVQSITKNLDFYNNSKNTLQEFLADIFDTIFVHRFKDIDPKIRIECIKALYHWIELYPEFFFENSFLRYFGWLLFDMNNQVKIEVLKNLTRLYKKNTNLVISGLKQFTERFKTNIISLLIDDLDYNIKINCLHLLVEINKIGFLEDREILKINNLAFQIMEQDSQDVLNEFNNVPAIHRELKENGRLLNELIKFINHIEVEKTGELKEQHKLSIDYAKKHFPIDVNDMIKFKTLIQIINYSKNFYNISLGGDIDDDGVDSDEDVDNLVLNKEIKVSDFNTSNKLESLGFQNTEILKQFLLNSNGSIIYLNQIARIGFLLYKNFSSYFKSWKFLLTYLTIDFSSIDELDEEFKKLIELNEQEDYFLLNLLYGILYAAITKESVSYYVADYNTAATGDNKAISKKKKQRKTKKQAELQKQAEREAESAAEAKANETKLAKTNMQGEEEDDDQEGKQDEGKNNDKDDENEDQVNNNQEEENNDNGNDEELDEVDSEEENSNDDNGDDDDNHSNPNSSDKILGQLINSLPAFFEKFGSVHYNYKVVFSIFLQLTTFQNFKDLQQETVLIKLIKLFLQVFKNSSVEILELKNEFVKFFTMVKQSLENNELSNDIKLLVQNAIIELSLELSNAVSEEDPSLDKFDNAVNILNNISLVLEKFLITGVVFNTSEFIGGLIVDEIGDKVFTGVMKIENSDLILESNWEQKAFKIQNQLQLVFKFYLNYVSWKFEKLYQFGKNSTLNAFIGDDEFTTISNNNSKENEQEAMFESNLHSSEASETSLSRHLDKIQTIIDQLSDLLLLNAEPQEIINGNNDTNGLKVVINKLKSASASYLIDIIIVVNLFYKNFQNDEKLTSSFDDFQFFFENQIKLNIFASDDKGGTDNEKLLGALLQIYFHLESDLALLLDVQLDRNDDESVNYGFLTEEDKASSTDQQQQQQFQQKLEYEKRLVGYTLKLLSLRNAKLVSKEWISRLYLNKEKLGGLYATVVDSKDNVDVMEAELKAVEGS